MGYFTNHPRPQPTQKKPPPAVQGPLGIGYIFDGITRDATIQTVLIRVNPCRKVFLCALGVLCGFGAQ
jgi:hypothetical protein